MKKGNQGNEFINDLFATGFKNPAGICENTPDELNCMGTTLNSWYVAHGKKYRGGLT